MDPFSFLNAIHPEVLEQTYRKYLESPDSIEPSWRSFFQGYDFGQAYTDVFLPIDDESLTKVLTAQPSNQTQQALEAPQLEHLKKEFKVLELINAYRTRGHLFTKTNPVRQRRKYEPTLAIENFGLSSNDLEQRFQSGVIVGLQKEAKLGEIIDTLQQIYCDSIGLEYMYINQPKHIEWIQNWINQNKNRAKLNKEEKEHIYKKLSQAVGFESFLHTKFVGQKRFSLEGCESLIPALDTLINTSADKHKVQEFIVGMAHRGRLNVLTNIFGKAYKQLFSEFEGREYTDAIFAGDVKYHLGSTHFIESKQGNKIKLNLAPNPSHLETVSAVVEGIARAKVDTHYHGDFSRQLPILIHGDAAVAGQGIVYEVVQMADLNGYKTGGTIHIVINNQVGFTTNYLDGRSSTYCTDVAKVISAPVIHVNADDVESVVHAFHFASDYRAAFGKDVFIDLLGYRKYGHNEGDEPRFTQPSLYKAIARHPNPAEIYKAKLLAEGSISTKVIETIQKEYKSLLDKDFEASKSIKTNDIEPFMADGWEGFTRATEDNKAIFDTIDTHISEKTLQKLTNAITNLPKGKNFMRKVARIIEGRKTMVEQNQIDWGTAEHLAYASLLLEGYNVRLSGEDVERGTFSHRHAVLKTEDTEEEYVPLRHIDEKQGRFNVFNSLLSEYGVLGFDYGYALAAPNTLTLWEAQFGDFVNGAQIIIDQYISAAEDKWKMQNGLVMLLPHGYEGQGAEHSSARLERFLQACALNNMTIANCTTPANFFHLLRRQMHRTFRKPLVVFTPKSLLRHPLAVSSMDDFTKGHFKPIMDDTEAEPNKPTRLVFCSGKTYYELLQQKKAQKADHIALVRLEQLYPFPKAELESIIKKYKKVKTLVWAQEEPENMGAWHFILSRLRDTGIEVVSPSESASPATGSPQRFNRLNTAYIKEVIQ